MAPLAHAADITVLASPAIREAYIEVVPRYEQLTGHKVITTWSGTTDIVKRLQARETYDVVIAASDTLDDLLDTGRIVAGSRQDIAASGVGVTVRSGAPKPDIGSSDAVKRALLAAKTVGISTGPSGVYMRSLFEGLGVVEAVKPKLRIPASGGQVAELVAKGEVELGFQQVSEIVHVRGADYVGPLPPDIQRITIFAGGVHAASSDPDVALTLLAFLGSPEHAALLQKHGLQTPSSSARPLDSSNGALSAEAHARIVSASQNPPRGIE
jgi:molybdate transport system substrate-binding protein